MIDKFNIDPSRNDNWGINHASEKGYAEIVTLLLSYPKVQPQIDNNYPIINASLNGHIETVKVLMKDIRVDPSAVYNSAVLFASRNRHFDIVKVLIQDQRVDPSISDSIVFIQASAYGDVELIQQLLNYIVVNPIANNHKALFNAVEYNHIDIIKIFYNNNNFDFRRNDSEIFEFAASNAKPEIVEYLSRLDKIQPEKTMSIYFSLNNKNYDSTISLLNDKRNNPANIKPAFYKRYHYHNTTKDTIERILSLLNDLNHNKKQQVILKSLCKDSRFYSEIDKTSKEWQKIKKYVLQNKINDF